MFAPPPLNGHSAVASLTSDPSLQLPMGTLVREMYEGFEAAVTGMQFHVNGCTRAVLAEKRLKDNCPVQRTSADIQALEIVKLNKKGLVIEPGAASDVLDLKAKDPTLGIEGVIVVVEYQADGSRMFRLQPKREKKDQEVDGYWICETLVELIDKPRQKTATPAGPGYASKSTAYGR